MGGRTLIVDAGDPAAFECPSAALRSAGPQDQIFIRPGRYEDKLFVSDRSIVVVGAGRDHVEIFSRRSGPLYLQRVAGGRISGVTFRYVGSDQHSAMNILDSACTITQCRARDGILSGVVVYGPDCRPSLIENDVCHNRESGIFVFGGARPYVAQNRCSANHHFGLAVRDPGSRPDLVRNHCFDNMLSGILLFYHAEALLASNTCRNNWHWGLVMTPDAVTSPPVDQLVATNDLEGNPRGPLTITEQPLRDIGR
ncbi:right-handed parallel beta-helix repeat-containing protein [Candidatus Nitrospira bockiana]